MYTQCESRVMAPSTARAISQNDGKFFQPNCKEHRKYKLLAALIYEVLVGLAKAEGRIHKLRYGALVN